MKRIIATVLAVIAILSISVPALAKEYIAYVNVSSLKVYEDRSTSSKRLGSISKGTQVKVYSEKNGWCLIRNSQDKVGYCLKSGLSTDVPMNGSAWVIAEDGCKITSMDGAKSTQIYYGQSFGFVKTDGSKTILTTKKGTQGWVYTKYVSRKSPFTLSNIAYIAESGKMLYKKACASGSANYAYKDTKVILYGKSSGGKWGYIDYKGKKYYVLMTMLTSSPNGNTSQIVATEGANLYKSASIESAAVAYIAKGTKMTIKGYSNAFYKVTTENGETGYIQTKYTKERK